jgi:hypothetical protein
MEQLLVSGLFGLEHKSRTIQTAYWTEDQPKTNSLNRQSRMRKHILRIQLSFLSQLLFGIRRSVILSPQLYV